MKSNMEGQGHGKIILFVLAAFLALMVWGVMTQSQDSPSKRPAAVAQGQA